MATLNQRIRSILGTPAARIQDVRASFERLALTLVTAPPEDRLP